MLSGERLKSGFSAPAAVSQPLVHFSFHGFLL